MNHRLQTTIFTIVFMLCVVSCTKVSQTIQELSKPLPIKEDLHFEMILPQSVADPVQRATITVISDSSLLNELDLTKIGRKIKGTIESLPVGHELTFTLTLSDFSGRSIYEGTTVATLTKDVPNPLTIQLKPIIVQTDFTATYQEPSRREKPAKEKRHVDSRILFTMPFDGSLACYGSNADLWVTMHGEPHFVQGVHGKAISFGEQDYITLEGFTLTDRQNLTFSAWVKPDHRYVNNGPEDIVSKHSCFTDCEFLFRLEKGCYDIDWTIGGKFHDMSTVPQTDPDGDGNDGFGLIPPTFEGFDHYVATYNGKMITFYINGKKVHEKEASGDIIQNMTNTLTIGARADQGTSEKFVGEIDELTFFNTALTAKEVRKRYENKW